MDQKKAISSFSLNKLGSKTARDFVFAIFTRGNLLIGGFIASILLARFLGAEGRGEVTAIFLVPTLILSISDLGIRQAIAYFIGQKVHPIEDIIKTTYFIWIITSIVSVSIIFLYFGFFYYGKYNITLLLIAMCSVPFSLFSRYTRGILQGRDKVGRINKLELVNVGVNLFSILILVILLGLNVLGAALVNLIIELQLAIQCFFIIEKITKFRIRYLKGLPLKLIRMGIVYAVPLFVLQLNYRINILILERLSDTRSVGIFSVGTSLAELIWQIPAAVGVVLFAKSANSRTKEEAACRAAKLLRVLLPIIFIICIIMVVFTNQIITILYGHDYMDAISVIRFLMPGIFMMVFFKVLQADMAGRGKPLFALAIFILPLILNVILSILLVPRYNVNGSAIASSISYSVGAVLFLWFYSRNSGVKLRDLLFMRRSDLRINMKLGRSQRSSKGATEA